MTTMDDKRADVSRKPCYLLKLHMDMCTKLNPSIGSGDSSGAPPDECNAVVPCHYTWFTCQDNANYTKGERLFQFSNWEAPLPGTYPIMDRRISQLPIKVNTDKFRTEVGELSVDMKDFPLSAQDTADPDKIRGGYSRMEVEGARFWTTWKARNKNYCGRRAELYFGYIDVDPADYELLFTGVLYDIAVSTSKGTAKVVLRSYLWETANKKFPIKVSDKIVLKGAMTAVSTVLFLTDGTHTFNGTALFDVATTNQPRTVKIQDEYITYTGLSYVTYNPALPTTTGGTQLTGVTRGAFGTIPAIHALGEKAEQVTIYAEDDAALWDDCGRVLADHCFMDMLLFYAKVPIDYVKTYSHGVFLTADINASVTTIPVSSVADLPEYGVVRIDDEYIWYRGILGTDLINCRRGQYGTTAATHEGEPSEAAEVLVSAPTEAIGHWHPGLMLKARFESEKDVASRIESWRASTFTNVWPCSDGKIDVSQQVPPISTYDRDYTDADIVQGSKVWTGNDKTRKSRVEVWYRPRKPDPKTSGDDDKELEEEYFGMAGYVDFESENVNVYGDHKLQIIFGEWLDDIDDALWVAKHYWTRVHQGIASLEATMELKDDNAQLMDLVGLSIAEDVDADGILQRVFYLITSKVKDGINKIKMVFEQAGFGGTFRYAAIGPLNPTLKTSITATDPPATNDYLDVNLSATTLLAYDFASGETPHQIMIEEEKITYTTATDWDTLFPGTAPNNAVRLLGITRARDGTAAAIHTAPVDVVMEYSAAAEDTRRRYGWIGSTGDPPTGDQLDADGDFTEEEAGYMIW
jgi:hypothetical protein